MPERKTAPGRRHPQAGSTSDCWLTGTVCAVSEVSVLAGTYLTWPDAPAAYRRAVKLHVRCVQISLLPTAATTIRLRAIRGAVDRGCTQGLSAFTRSGTSAGRRRVENTSSPAPTTSQLTPAICAGLAMLIRT
jgi:hypothetical protein